MSRSKSKWWGQLAWSLLTIQHLEAQQTCGDNVDMELPKAPTSAANAPRAASHIFSSVPPQDVHTALKLSACPLISLCGVYLEVQACEVHLWLSTALHGPIPYGEFPGFLGGSVVKNLPTNAGETQAWSPVQEDPTCLGASKHHHC